MIIDKNVKHYFQNSVDCGPTSLKMIAWKQYPYKKLKFFDDICNLHGHGTSIYNLSEGAMILGYKTFLYQNSEIENIKQMMKKGYSIIVLYSFGIVGHYSTIKKINDKFIWLLDPTMGLKKYENSYFETIWKTSHEDGFHNFLAIKY